MLAAVAATIDGTSNSLRAEDLSVEEAREIAIDAYIYGDAKPPAEDTPMLERMARIGIVPGKPFELAKLDSAVQEALKDEPEIDSRRSAHKPIP